MNRTSAPSAGAMWRNWMIYGISSVASRLVGVLMLPIYTRVLSPEEYGIRAMVTVGVDLVGMVCSLGLVTAMVRHYTGDGDERHPEAISTAYLTAAITLAGGLTLGFLGAPWLATLVLGDAAYAHFLRLGLVSLFFMNTMDVGLAYLRLRQRAGTVALVALSTLALTVALNIVFVVILRWGVTGILYGEIITFALFSTLVARHTLRDVGLRVSGALARRMIAYGAPLTLMPFAWLLVNRSDGVFLTHYGSLAAVGVYALAVQCAQVLLLAVVGPFRDVWDPAQFQLATSPDGRRVYRRMFQTFSFALVVAAFAFAVAAEDVSRVMAAPRFHAAATVVPILLAAYVITGLSLFFNSGLLVKNRTALLGGIALLTAVVNLAANALLVPRYLVIGAALSRVIALAVMAGVTCAVAQRLWPQRPDFAALAKAAVLAAALFGVAQLLPQTGFIVALGLKAALVVVLVVLGVLTGAVERSVVTRAITLSRGAFARRRRRAASHRIASPVVPRIAGRR